MTGRRWRRGGSWGAKPGATLVTIVEEGASPPDEAGRRDDDRLIGAVAPADADRIIAAVNRDHDGSPR